MFGGRITGLEGGIYGRADIPFAAFFATGFAAYDGITALSLTGAPSQVPEPSTLVSCCFWLES